MGTSVSQRSPDNDNWRLVQRAYENPAVPVDQALRDVWRAASNANELNLAALLSQPAIGEMATLVSGVSSHTEAFQEVARFVADNKVASLASEIAKRAVIQSAGTEKPIEAYAERLFMEATNYLVARDIAGHIKAGARLQSVSDARVFTDQMMDMTGAAVRRQAVPERITGESWSSFVTSVIGEIRRRPRR